jgi:hypothetical protein
LLGLLTLVVVALGALQGLMHREAARWPTLADTPRVHAPTTAARGGGQAWERFEAALVGAPSYAAELAAHLEPEGPPAEAALSAADDFAPCLRLLRAAVDETDGLVVPLPRALDAPGPDLLPYIHVARAWLLSAWGDAAAGDPALALTEMLRAHELGVRFAEGESGYVGVMVGLTIERLARGELRELLAHYGREQPPLYDQAAGGLRAVAPGVVARGLATEAQLVEGMLVAHGATASLIAAWTYDEDLTRVWYRRHMQGVVDRAALPRWERDATALVEPWASATSWPARWHNRTGRVLLEVVSASYGDSVSREDAAVAGGRLLIMSVALQRYALSHEGLAASSQAALVPELLPAPLLDPFDGEPLRLDAAQVWSVGEARGSDTEPLRLLRFER